MNVIIMRGIPGSGKSTWVADERRKLLNPIESMICSADDFHYVDGQYRYSSANAGLAHAACLRKYANWLSVKSQDYTIFVDNTNTTAAEIAPYYALALAYEVPVKIVRVCCDMKKALDRQTHNVPHSTVFAMQQNINNERLPAYWKEEFVWV